MHKGVGKARLEVSSVSDISLFSYRDLRDVFTLMVIGYTFRGSNSFIFIFASHLNGGQLLKKRICSPRSKFFSLRVDPVLKGLHCPVKQIGSKKNCLPLKTGGHYMLVFLYTTRCQGTPHVTKGNNFHDFLCILLDHLAFQKRVFQSLGSKFYSFRIYSHLERRQKKGKKYSKTVLHPLKVHPFILSKTYYIPVM